MMYSKIKYAISVYGLTSLENINKIQVLQINCQRFSHLKTTDTQQIQRIHIAWRMRRQVSTVILTQTALISLVPYNMFFGVRTTCLFS